jgi:hypothetical protein
MVSRPFSAWTTSMGRVHLFYTCREQTIEPAPPRPERSAKGIHSADGRCEPNPVQGLPLFACVRQRKKKERERETDPWKSHPFKALPMALKGERLFRHWVDSFQFNVCRICEQLHNPDPIRTVFFFSFGWETHSLTRNNWRKINILYTSLLQTYINLRHIKEMLEEE